MYKNIRINKVETVLKSLHITQKICRYKPHNSRYTHKIQRFFECAIDIYIFVHQKKLLQQYEKNLLFSHFFSIEAMLLLLTYFNFNISGRINVYFDMPNF